MKIMTATLLLALTSCMGCSDHPASTSDAAPSRVTAMPGVGPAGTNAVVSSGTAMPMGTANPVYTPAH